MINLTIRTPDVIQAELAERVRVRRKELHYSQAELARRSGVSLGSLKRFKHTHEISLASLVKLSFALGCNEDFDKLFVRQRYGSIEEVISDAEQHS